MHLQTLNVALPSRAPHERMDARPFIPCWVHLEHAFLHPRRCALHLRRVLVRCPIWPPNDVFQVIRGCVCQCKRCNLRRTYNLASSTEPATSAATYNPVISPENFVATVCIWLCVVVAAAIATASLSGFCMALWPQARWLLLSSRPAHVVAAPLLSPCRCTRVLASPCVVAHSTSKSSSFPSAEPWLRAWCSPPPQCLCSFSSSWCGNGW